MSTTDRPAARDQRLGELYAALTAAGYGSAYVATSFALRSFDPLPIAVWRSLLAAVGLAIFLAISRRSGTTAAAADRPAVAGALRLVVLAMLAGPIFLVSMNLGVAEVGATIASFVAGLYAVLSAVFAPAFLPERLTRRAVVGFAAALVGTALLADLDPAGAGSSGVAWGLVAAVSFALFLVLTRRWSVAYGLDGAVVGLATMVAAIVGVLALGLFGDIGTLVPATVRPDALVALGWLALVGALGQVLAVASVRLIPAQRSAAFLLLNPITAALLAVVLLGERPAPLQVVGGLIVLAGIAVATGALPPSRSTAPESYSAR